jgi:hypothetical protein
METMLHHHAGPPLTSTHRCDASDIEEAIFLL